MKLLDTNVLIYGFDPASAHYPWAKRIIRSALLGDGAAINPVILAEYLVGEQEPDTATTRLKALGVIILDLPSMVAPRCAKAYSCYLQQRKHPAGKAAAKSPLPDFFIGAHAAVLSLPLVTADSGRYRSYFPEIELVAP
jgi:predicted nucleic acid-binding protein